jgi:multisubunit Na+/H+ antiporter MnhE subunit
MILLLVLISLWFVFSGYISLLPLLPGLLLIVLIMYLRDKAFFKSNYAFLKIKKFEYLFFYLPYIIKEIIISNFSVAKAILTLNINPKIVELTRNIDQKTVLLNFLNSITLTPGTFVLYVDDETIVVHCLTDSSKNSLLDNTMLYQNKNLEDI